MTVPSRSTLVAAEALAGGGTVLDVGCGGGAAAFALVPPATEVVGTDRQEDMLRLFATTAAERGIPALTVHGSWPDIVDAVPEADVVVCHNVLYNAPDLLGFVSALSARARRRVVIEITERHPQVTRAPLWRHFWGLDRPSGPDALLAAEALREAGFPVVIERRAAAGRMTSARLVSRRPFGAVSCACRQSARTRSAPCCATCRSRRRG
ncbi:MAG: class I SAM-dependent methyltransferase [Actinomycetota bacterium]|nr:class I SAM-dependent methyltransferase [Actinomycetota bacterium]